jgi:putative FmdB family regulatory protein
MKFSDYRCKDCEEVFEFTLYKHLDNFPEHPECEHCGSENTKRIYSNITFDIAEGKTGNSKNGYSTGITSHPSSMLGKQKGKKIKTIR